MTMKELAERVEAATGPDRDIDHAIANLINYATVGEVLTYTASLDAAMTLVPDGFMWRVQSDPDGVVEALAEKDAGDFGAIDARHTQTFAATPALALTATALLAIASQETTR
jgi:hypothetical protein